MHSRLIENSEEIRLIEGQLIEYNMMNECYYSLVSMLNQHLRIRTLFVIAEEFITKYIWGLLGYLLCIAPIFLGDLNTDLVSNRAKGTFEN